MTCSSEPDPYKRRPSSKLGLFILLLVAYVLLVAEGLIELEGD